MMSQFKMYFLLLTIFVNSTGYSQHVFYQDVFHGGVTGGGFSTGLGIGVGNLQLYIEPTSTIRKAFILAFSSNSAEDTLFINGDGFGFNQETVIANMDHTSLFNSPQQLHLIDITEWLDNNLTDNFLIEIPNQLELPFKGLFAPFLIIEYENIALPLVNTVFIANTQDFDGELIYGINNLNQISSVNPVGFSIYSDRITSSLNDSEEFYIEGNLLGLLNGPDNVNNSWDGGGVKGHFYYQGNQLFGLDDDVANNTMGGSDGLADISSYLVNNTTDLNFVSRHLMFPIQSNKASNSMLAYFLTYTTPCDTFSVSVPNDTTLCYGETLQLPSINSGTAYEWLPSTGLSCSDCPDPIFTADSSMFYTVRIWNNDSCSVVRPLKINVSRTQIDSLDVSPPDCGASNGSIVVYAHNTLNDTLLFSLNGTSTGSATVTGSATINGLAEGTYTISVQDAMGCPVVDSTIVLNAVNNTVAQFALNPDVGNVPLEIDVYNQSQNAIYYEWYINGVYAGDNLGGYTIENGGEHVFELVAWQYDPSCADTFSVIVWASEVIIPTAFTPNNDGDNDVWEIVNLDAHFPKNKVKVFNRWGNLLFESNEGNYAMNPWDGMYNGEPVPVGSYYFIIETHTEGVGDFKGSVTVVRE